MTSKNRLDGQGYGKFPWRDWLSDPGLRGVSFAAKGMWMDMLAFIHTDAERGFLTVNGKAATTPQIAKMLGADTRQVASPRHAPHRAGAADRAFWCRADAGGP